MTAPGASPTLRRALGRWDLTAIGINQTIGGAVFLLPSAVAAAAGGWSPFAFVLGAGVSLLVALSLAEVGSRFVATGGPYLYARTTLGRFVGFEVGWMQWFTRVTSHASVSNGLALALGYYWPGAASGAGRVAVIGGVTAILTAINVRGIRQGARAVNVLTVGKLLPLVVVIAFGLFAIDWTRFGPFEPLSIGQVASIALLMVFVFGGFEVLTVPAGEARDPRQHVPFALVTTVLVVATVMTLAQVVTVGTLDGLASSTTPLADAASVFLGAGGALLIGIGSVLAMTGNLAGQILTGSRMLYALAEQGDLPPALARIHPVHRTPARAICFTAAVALALALSGSFVWMAVASALARLITYAASAAAAVLLRHPRFARRAEPASFLLPGGYTLPVITTLLALAIMTGATRDQVLGGLAALVAGALLFAAARVFDKRRITKELRGH